MLASCVTKYYYFDTVINLYKTQERNWYDLCGGIHRDADSDGDGTKQNILYVNGHGIDTLRIVNPQFHIVQINLFKVSHNTRCDHVENAGRD